jgi:hypothetical protein
MSRDYMDPKNRLKNMVMANKNEIRRSKFKICLTILGILPFMAVSSSLAGKASLWLYSPDGVGNFQKLAIGPAMTNGGLIQLILADFNGDKTTDVFTTTPVGNAGAHQWMYSNGGRSDFIKIAVGPGIGNIAFGDFDGDGRTDVFATKPLANGAYRLWVYSPGGAGNFIELGQFKLHSPEFQIAGYGNFDGANGNKIPPPRSSQVFFSARGRKGTRTACKRLGRSRHPP